MNAIFLYVLCFIYLIPIAVYAADDVLFKRKTSYWSCNACHSRNVDETMLAPSYRDVSAKFRGNANALEKIKVSIKNGTHGNRYNDIDVNDLQLIASYILGLSGGSLNSEYAIRQRKAAENDGEVFREIQKTIDNSNAIIQKGIAQSKNSALNSTISSTNNQAYAGSYSSPTSNSSSNSSSAEKAYRNLSQCIGVVYDRSWFLTNSCSEEVTVRFCFDNWSLGDCLRGGWGGSGAMPHGRTMIAGPDLSKGGNWNARVFACEQPGIPFNLQLNGNSVTGYCR